MTTTRELHLELIATIAAGLTTLIDEVTFLGGATIGLYISDPLAPNPRPTDDVDCIIEVVGRVEYWKLEDQVRARGFLNSTTPGDPICRWMFSGVKVDVMPTDKQILGFSNRWYPNVVATRQRVPVKNLYIFVPEPPLQCLPRCCEMSNRATDVRRE